MKAARLDPGHRTLSSLDGIRGLAVLLVIGSHFVRFLPDAPFLLPLKAVMTYGWAGVDLFFVLSGFLITGILLKSKGAANYFGTFYMRRVLRIFPLYYAVLIAVFLAAPHLPAAAQEAVPRPDDRWLYFVYLTNWLVLWHGTWGPNVVGHFWSLAVEEQFYLVWPFIVFVLPERRVAIASIFLAVAALIVRLVWIAHTGPAQALAIATVTRMDSLALGALGAILIRRGLNAALLRVTASLAVVSFLVYVAGAIGFDRGIAQFSESVGFTILAVSFGAFVLWSAATDGAHFAVQRILTARPLRSIGRYSYGIYVYHVPILGACEILILRRLPPELASNPFFAVVYVLFLTALSYGVAAVSYETFERRFLSLKRYFEPAAGTDSADGTLTTAGHLQGALECSTLTPGESPARADA